MPASSENEREESTASDEGDSSEEVNRSLALALVQQLSQSHSVPDQSLVNTIMALNPQIRSEIASLLQGSNRTEESQSSSLSSTSNPSVSSQVTNNMLQANSLLSSALQNQAYATSANPFAQSSMPSQQQVSLPLQTVLLHQAILSGMNPSQFFLNSQVNSASPQGQARTTSAHLATSQPHRPNVRVPTAALLSSPAPAPDLPSDSRKSLGGEHASAQDEKMPSADLDTKRKSGREQFPEKVFRILAELEREGRDDIVSFVRQGTAFQIHKPSEFETQILPLYFRQGSIASFRRQLNLCKSVPS